MRYVFTLLVLCAFWSCTQTHEHPDKKIFRYNQAGGINSLDPAFARDLSSIWATHQLFNGLLQMDNNMQISPCIAKHYTINQGGLHYQFTLRNDVYFHKNPCFGPDSTRAVRATDVVFSLNRLRNPEVASPGKWVLQDVDSIWAYNDTLVNITLKNAFAPFAGVLTMKYCSIVPKEAIDAYGSAFNENPVGTGPFRFVAWHRNEKLVFRKNEAYFERDSAGKQLPYLDGVAVSFITDPQASFLEFLKGNIDLISGLDAAYKDEIITANGTLKERYEKAFTLSKLPYLNTEYLIFNVDTAGKGIQQDIRLRQAINIGFNRKTMMAYLRNTIGRAADGGIIPYGLPGTASGEGYAYAPERAKMLLEAIKADSGDVPTITLTTVANYRDLCEYIQSELGKLGLNIIVDVVPPANLREQKAQGTLNFFRASWIADYPDAENYLSLFYSPNRSPNGPNYSRYFNPVFDSLYTLARSSIVAEGRIATYLQLDRMIIDDAPIVPLYYDEVVRIHPKNITGLEGNSLNLLDLRFVDRTLPNQ